jgi:hypothetical protein
MTSVSDVTGTELLPNGQNLDAAIAEGKRAHQLDRAHVFHSWSAQAKLAPMTVIAAQGSYLGTATVTGYWTSRPRWSIPTSAISTRRWSPPSPSRPPSCAPSPPRT